MMDYEREPQFRFSLEPIMKHELSLEERLKQEAETVIGGNSVLANVVENNPVEFATLEREILSKYISLTDVLRADDKTIVEDENVPGKKDIKVWLNVANIVAVGKTALSGGLYKLFEAYFMEMIPPGQGYEKFKHRPRVFFHDLAHSLPYARELGMLTSPPGEITSEEFEGIAKFDDKVCELGERYIPGNALFLREIVLLTENFGKGRQRIGVPRGSLNSIMQMNEREIPTFIAFLVSPEERRREKIEEREEMAKLSSDRIKEVEAERGLESDLSAEEAQAMYGRVDKKVSDQNVSALLNVVARLIYEKQIRDREIESLFPRKEELSGLMPEEMITDFWTLRIFKRVEQDPSLLERIIKEIAIPRLVDGIYGTPLHPHVAVFDNPTLPEGVKRTELRNYLKKHSIIEALKLRAQITKDPELIKELIALKILPEDFTSPEINP